LIKFNEIQTKIFIVLVLVISIIVLISYSNYNIQKRNYNEFIEYSIKNAIDKIRNDIQRVEDVVTKSVHYKYAMFERIHKSAISELQKNKDFDLQKLKKSIDSKFKSELLSVNLYLINKNLVIFNTTNKKDLNLDMKNFLGAREYIHNAFKQPEKVFIAHPAYDVLDKKYTIYSYATLDKEKNILLEIGFFDKMASQIKDRLYKFDIDNSIIKEVDLYSNYGKYIVNLTDNKQVKNKTKQEFMLERIDSQDKDILLVKEVSKNKKQHVSVVHEDNKTYRVYFAYILDIKISDSKVKNYVLKTKVDVTHFEKKLQDLKIFFYLTLVASIAIILTFFLFFHNAFVKPFKYILHSMQNWKRIDDKKLLNKNDEFSKLAHTFNQSYDKQLELSTTLEEKVNKAVFENKQKEKLLQEHSRLVQMGEMLSMIAHQWRQPLGAIGSAIIGMKLQLISKKVDFTNKIDREKYITSANRKYDTISEYVQFLSTTIDDFRNFFKQDKEKEFIDLSAQIKKALHILDYSLKKHEIKIVTNFEVDEKLFLYKNELIQVVLNILKNSEDNFLEKNISDPLISIETIKDSHNYIISIKDNGGGIPESILCEIFNPYFSTKSEKNGTGLGLYMSKIMIEEHNNGRLTAENTDNGICFKIFLNPTITN